jgi:arsenate reductase (thioredoxin)
MRGKPSVLFVCTHNAGRSQMAAALLSHLAGDRVVVHSAGTEPEHVTSPAAILAMAEIGIDIAATTPRRLTRQMVEASDMVITMGCGDISPYCAGVDYRNWQLDDPAGQPPDIVRAIRDAIVAHVNALAAEILSNGNAR